MRILKDLYPLRGITEAPSHCGSLYGMDLVSHHHSKIGSFLPVVVRITRTQATSRRMLPHSSTVSQRLRLRHLGADCYCLPRQRQ